MTVKLKVDKNTDLPLLSKLLDSGELALTGLDNRTLKVPKQNLEVSLALKQGKTTQQGKKKSTSQGKEKMHGPQQQNISIGN